MLPDSCRYSENLESLLEKLHPDRVLFSKIESDYQGSCDVDVLLKDGRIFSYYYSYGSCYGCDGWEDRNLTEEQIEDEMLQEATFFKDMEEYVAYRESCSKYK